MQSTGALTSMEDEVAGPPRTLPSKPLFEPLRAHEMSDGVRFREVSVPPHRRSPLKKVRMGN
ncbi:hypothetical protein C1H46_043084 [Malus baccata]|uniref:Uncharacterized protein n=1 Tax=Malus baccata TaxID=106549 RepID=A0A540KAX1_MALBA|nr:hypothetical protein C1H46_043084 [Malus baccata]